MKTTCFTLLSLFLTQLLNAQAISRIIDSTCPATSIPDVPVVGCVTNPALDSECLPLPMMPPGCWKQLCDKTIGVSYSHQLQARDPDDIRVPEATFVLISPAVLPPFLSFTPAGLITVSDTGIVPGSLNLYVEARLGTCTFRQTFSITIRRNPIDIALILDNSGSMSGSVGSSNRWNVLTTGATAFINNANDFTQTGDMIGARFFSTTVSSPTMSPFNGNLFSFSATSPNATGITNLFSGKAPDDMTAMGQGLVAGKTLLTGAGTDASHRKKILLFTDGMETEPPYLTVTAGPPATYTVTHGGVTISQTDDIDIFAIGIGSTGGWESNLINLSQATGETALIVSPSETNPDLRVSDYFVTGAGTRIMRDGSPKLVGIREGQFKPSLGATATASIYLARDSFKLNSGIDKISFNLIAPLSSEPVIVSVTKGGIDFTQYLECSRAGDCQTCHLNLNRVNPRVSSAGMWVVRMRLGTRRPANYLLSMIADDHVFKYNGYISNSDVLVNQEINPSLELLRNNVPYTSASSVGVIILKPGEDLGDLLARTQANVAPSRDSSDQNSVGNLKYLELLKDSAFVNKLKLQNNLVNLTYNNAQKKYTGKFNGLNVSGIYQAIFVISFIDSIYGNVERIDRQSFYVRFKDVNIDASNATLSTVSTPKLGTLNTLTFRPKASNGRLIGPGWGRRIKLNSSSGAVITGVQDKGDGTYDVQIKGELNGTGALTLGGAKVIDGNLSNLRCYDQNASFLKKICCFFKRLFG